MCDLDIKAGGQTGGDRIEDVKIFTGQNEYITGTAQAECIGDKVREERLRWLGMCRGGVVDIPGKGC